MNIAIILSGGTGTRLGADIPKQYIKVQSKPLIAYGLERYEFSTKEPLWKSEFENTGKTI